jgi:hypothetical protein
VILHASVLIYFLYQEAYRTLIVQYETKVQELKKCVESLERRLKVCMPAYMDWDVIGSFH